MRQITTFFLLTLSVACVDFTESTKPGVQARITKKAFDYINTIAQRAINEKLKSVNLPDMSGKDGHVEWEFKNIQNRGVTVPNSNMAISSAGLTWSLSGLGLKLHADWRVKYKKGIIHISTSGSVDVKFSKISLSVTAFVGKDATGRPSIKAVGCKADVGDVDVDFHGGISSLILNLLKSKVEHEIKDAIKPKMCEYVNKEINEDAEARLQKINVNVEIDNRFVLDYSLVSTPVWTSNYLETQHKGEVYWLGNKTEAPMVPGDIPPLNDTSKMMYVWLTDYTANTLWYSAQTHHFLQYNFTKKDLPDDHSGILNTTCETICVGKVIPQIGKMYPNSVVDLLLNSTVVPKVSFQHKSISGLFEGTVAMFAHTSTGKTAYLVTLKMKIGFEVTASVKDDKLVGKILDHNFSLSVEKSAIGKLNPQALNVVFKAAIDLAVIPALDKMLAKGVELPVSGDVTFNNTELAILDNSLLVSTDLLYKPSNGLFFTPEIFHQNN